MKNSKIDASPSLCEGGRKLVTSPSSSSGGGQNKVYITANPKSYRTIKIGRDELKKNPTEAEEILWNYLKNKQTGHKIRRQHIIHHFIVDFVCLKISWSWKSMAKSMKSKKKEMN